MPVTYYSEGEYRTVLRMNQTLVDKVAVLEALRPHWAQGYTDDGIAAQTMSAALSDIWQLLGVDNQTAAMVKLRLLVPPKENNA